MAVIRAKVLATERHPLELSDVRRVGNVEHLALPWLHAVAEIVICQAVEDPDNLKTQGGNSIWYLTRHVRKVCRVWFQFFGFATIQVMFCQYSVPAPSWASWQLNAGCMPRPPQSHGTFQYHRSSHQGGGLLSCQTPGSQLRGSVAVLTVRWVV